MHPKGNGTELNNMPPVHLVALEWVFKRFAFLVTICLVLSIQAFAQNSSTGEITGVVTDSSGAGIPSAEVAVRNQATGVVVNVKTTGAGDYEAMLLPPGTYQVTVARKGFKAYQKRDIPLEVDQSVRVDAQLTLGSVSEVVNVVGAPPLIATGNSQIETNFSTEMTQELPLVGRAVTDLSLLAPGTSTAQSDAVAYYAGNPNMDTGRINVQGARAFTIDATLNGGSILLPTSNNFQPMVPSLGAVSEFAVILDNFSAQYASGSSVLNMVTKSGTNRFHGTGFDYVENDALDAIAGFTTSKPRLRYNQFGGAIGGPVIKNKLFFFFSYENTLQPASYGSIVTVPTAAELQGNFSAFCTTPTSCNPTIVNPSTGVPFPDNTINVPLDTVAKAASSYWPAPNYGPAGATADNYFRLIPQTSQHPLYDYKVDWFASKAHQLTFTAHNLLMRTQHSGDIPGPACYGGEQCGSSGQYEEFFQLGEKWTISSNLVNSFFFSALREHYWNFSPTSGGGYPAKLGLNANGISQAVFPDFDISGGPSTSLGSGENSYSIQNNFTESDVLNWSRGSHLFAFGGQLAKSQILLPSNPGVPTFNFNGQYTGTGETGQGGIGIGLADFLLGDVQSYSYSAGFLELGARRTFAALFLEDDWKVTPTLTLNLGVRYQFEGGFSEAHNFLALFSPTAINPATNTPGAIVYASAGHRLAQANHPALFAPRLGFAKSFGQKTVLRGGFGVFFTQINEGNNYPGAPPGYAISQSLISPQTVPVTPPVFQLENGPPAYTLPNPAARNGAILNGQILWNYSPYNGPQQYAQEWHLSVQRQLDAKTTLEIAYVGEAGVHLETWINANQVPLDQLGSPTDISNPQLLVPYPQYSLIQAYPHESSSNYNALEVQAKRRFANGLTFLANYARSRSWDDSSFDATTWRASVYQNGYNLKANYGPSSFDEPNIVKLAYVYDLPIGHGRMLLKDDNKVLDKFVGGWLTSGNFSAHSGYPDSVTSPTNNGSLGGWNSSEFANRVGNAPDPHTESEWFNLSNFANPAPYTYGNSGRNCIREPGGWFYDFAMEKSFPIWESVRIKLRMDAYNFFNHMNLGPSADFLGPTGSNPALTGSGMIISGSPPRIMQIGLQLDF